MTNDSVLTKLTLKQLRQLIDGVLGVGTVGFDSKLRTLRGLLLTDRGVPRGHMDVLAVDGAVIGQTTSGTFSPTLKQGIALALVATSAGVGPGDPVLIDVRGRKLAAKIVGLPFVESHVR